MAFYNPDVLMGDNLSSLSTHDILVSIYQYMVATVSVVFSLAFFYFLVKFLFWFLPKYWYRSSDKDA